MTVANSRTVPGDRRGPVPPPAEQDAGRLRFVRSYLLMRVVIGTLGVSLPIGLIFVDGLWLDSGTVPRGSMSAYYHSGARDLFVAALCAIGFFLVTYRVSYSRAQNLVTTLAGSLAIGVALLPTTAPGNGLETPLQLALGEGLVARLHAVCATGAILLLAGISCMFAKVEQSRDEAHEALFTRSQWARFHRCMAGGIVLAVLAIALSAVTGVGDATSLFWGEFASLLFFGLSWFAKGSEITKSWRPTVAPHPSCRAPLDS